MKKYLAPDIEIINIAVPSVMDTTSGDVDIPVD